FSWYTIYDCLCKTKYFLCHTEKKLCDDRIGSGGRVASIAPTPAPPPGAPKNGAKGLPSLPKSAARRALRGRDLCRRRRPQMRVPRLAPLLALLLQRKKMGRRRPIFQSITP